MLAAVPNAMQEGTCALGVAGWNIRVYGHVILFMLKLVGPSHRCTRETTSRLSCTVRNEGAGLEGSFRNTVRDRIVCECKKKQQVFSLSCRTAAKGNRTYYER